MDNGIFVRMGDNGPQLVEVRNGIENTTAITESELAQIKVGVWPSVSLEMDIDYKEHKMDKLIGIDPTAIYVVTSDDWFYDANGNNVKGAVGFITPVKAEVALGFQPKRSADWFLQIDTPSGQTVYIAGCKIHHVCLAKKGEYPNNSLAT